MSSSEFSLLIPRFGNNLKLLNLIPAFESTFYPLIPKAGEKFKLIALENNRKYFWPTSWGHYCIDVKLSRGNVIPSLNGSI